LRDLPAAIGAGEVLAKPYASSMAHESRESDRWYLDLAARGALRALGDAEPNPLVGAVLVRDGRIIGAGHHRRFGGPHAEREALADAARRGESPRGATLYCTLEPCTHHGKTPPCTDAILAAQIARVVIARRDPNPQASGGAELLRARGIEVAIDATSDLANEIADPFVTRITQGRPFVIAKWAQTIDGRVATKSGDSRWLSCERSRRRVHRLRSRVDAILTGVGTVLADDPELTARGVRVHRVARRIVLDSALRIPIDCKLVRSAGSIPLTIVYNANEVAHSGDPGRLEVARRAGVALLPAPSGPSGLDLRAALRALAPQGVSTVLVEAGPRVLGALIEQDCVDRALVYIAPRLMGDAEAMPVTIGRSLERLSDASQWSLARVKRVDDDLEVLYRRVRNGAAR
jgi:diaminohydroxyphosphoribosylaminopyrimidine deaminase/5-amino-6-(5-phosphoribosylamino)uracil reductase